MPSEFSSTESADALVIERVLFRYPGQAGPPPTPGFELRVPAFRVGRGEQVLLASRSGSGKSTLLSLIAGLMEPTRTAGGGGGGVRIGGQDIHALKGPARDRFRGSTLGMIFQTFNLLQGFTALENVLAAMMFSAIPPREHRRRGLTLLQTLGLSKPFAMVDELSVGQQQRVAVARALACDPVLVLADEPTASLDPENAAIAVDLIQSACRSKGAALLCVSHDPSIAGRFVRRERFTLSDGGSTLESAGAGVAAGVGVGVA